MFLPFFATAVHVMLGCFFLFLGILSMTALIGLAVTQLIFYMAKK